MKSESEGTYDPIELLYFAINHHGFEIVSDDGKYIVLKSGFTIEIEHENLFKLSQDGAVIAPFHEVYDLCHFIIKIQENG